MSLSYTYRRTHRLCFWCLCPLFTHSKTSLSVVLVSMFFASTQQDFTVWVSGIYVLRLHTTRLYCFGFWYICPPPAHNKTLLFGFPVYMSSAYTQQDFTVSVSGIYVLRLHTTRLYCFGFRYICPPPAHNKTLLFRFLVYVSSACTQQDFTVSVSGIYVLRLHTTRLYCLGFRYICPPPAHNKTLLFRFLVYMSSACTQQDFTVWVSGICVLRLHTTRLYCFGLWCLCPAPTDSRTLVSWSEGSMSCTYRQQDFGVLVSGVYVLHLHTAKPHCLSLWCLCPPPADSRTFVSWSLGSVSCTYRQQDLSVLVSGVCVLHLQTARP